MRELRLPLLLDRPIHHARARNVHYVLLGVDALPARAGRRDRRRVRRRRPRGVSLRQQHFPLQRVRFAHQRDQLRQSRVQLG